MPKPGGEHRLITTEGSAFPSVLWSQALPASSKVDFETMQHHAKAGEILVSPELSDERAAGTIALGRGGGGGCENSGPNTCQKFPGGRASGIARLVKRPKSILTEADSLSRTSPR